MHVFLKGNIILIDTAGRGEPPFDTPSNIRDVKLKDYFQDSITDEVSAGHLHVVNRIDTDELERLWLLRKKGKKI